MSQRELRFNWYWDYDENVRAHRVMLVLRESAPWLRIAYGVLLAGALAAALAIVLAPAGKRGELASNALPLLLLGGFILGFYRYLLVTERPSAFREAIDTTRPITVTISDEGYSAFLQTAGSHPWEHFRGVRETDDFLLFFLAERGAYYLPKHAIASEDDLRAVREVLRDHFGERARLMDTPASDAHPHRAASA